MRWTPVLRCTAILGMFFASQPLYGVFHFMQIEQVIGGVQGDTTAQAIQLRMRFASQSIVSQARLMTYDAAGANPVAIISPFPGNVTNFVAGDRVLVASAQFANTQMPPPVTADFTMTNLIPAGYLPAGRLTFENAAGTIIYWSLCWGGAGYTGSTLGIVGVNDLDGIFGPCFAGPLSSASNQALQFTGATAAVSTNNAADYAVTAGNAVFTSNAGAGGTVPVELLELTVE